MEKIFRLLKRDTTLNTTPVKKFRRLMFQNRLFPLEKLIGRISTLVSNQLAAIIFGTIESTAMIIQPFSLVYFRGVLQVTFCRNHFFDKRVLFFVLWFDWWEERKNLSVLRFLKTKAKTLLSPKDPILSFFGT